MVCKTTKLNFYDKTGRIYLIKLMHAYPVKKKWAEWKYCNWHPIHWSACIATMQAVMCILATEVPLRILGISHRKDVSLPLQNSQELAGAGAGDVAEQSRTEPFLCWRRALSPGTGQIYHCMGGMMYLQSCSKAVLLYLLNWYSHFLIFLIDIDGTALHTVFLKPSSC